MPAAKADTTQKDKGHKDIEIVLEDKEVPGKKGEYHIKKVAVGRMTPVVVITNPIAFTARVELAFRQAMKFACKRHDREGKLYWEVGESDEVIETAISDAIETLRTLGIQAERGIEFSPHLHRREW